MDEPHLALRRTRDEVAFVQPARGLREEEAPHEEHLGRVHARFRAVRGQVTVGDVGEQRSFGQDLLSPDEGRQGGADVEVAEEAMRHAEVGNGIKKC